MATKRNRRPESGRRARFVPCKVSLGFLPAERYVVLKPPQENVTASGVLVSASDVRTDVSPIRGQEIDGEVRVHVIKQTDAGLLVELPGQPVVGGLRVWVRNG